MLHLRVQGGWVWGRSWNVEETHLVSDPLSTGHRSVKGGGVAGLVGGGGGSEPSGDRVDEPGCCPATGQDFVSTTPSPYLTFAKPSGTPLCSGCSHSECFDNDPWIHDAIQFRGPEDVPLPWMLESWMVRLVLLSQNIERLAVHLVSYGDLQGTRASVLPATECVQAVFSKNFTES